MRSAALVQDRVDGASNQHFRVYREEQFFQTDEIETRIQHVSDLHENLNAAPQVVWLKGAPYVHDSQLDLHVKVEAVRWMLRIAKHMSDPAREVVLLRIENSLRQLEAAVGSRVRRAESPARAERFQRSAHA
jgi:hypothetical protein